MEDPTVEQAETSPSPSPAPADPFRDPFSTATTPALRVEGLRKLCTADVDEDCACELAERSVSLLLRCPDAKTRQSLECLCRALCRAHAARAAPALVARASAVAPSLDPLSCAALLRLSCAAAAPLAASSSPLDDLVRLHSRLAATLADAGSCPHASRARDAAQRCLARAVAEPAAAQAYAQAAAALVGAALAAAPAEGVSERDRASLRPFVGFASPALLAHKRAEFFGMCEKLLLEAAHPVPEAHAEAFRPLLVAATPEEFAASVGIPLAQKIASWITFDPMACVDEPLLIALTQGARSQDPALSSTSRAAILSLVKNVKELSGIERMADVFWKVMAGQDGPLAYAPQRSAMLHAVGCLRAAAERNIPLARLADTVATRLVAHEKKEANEEVKNVCLCELGRWLALSEALPKEAADLLVTPRVFEKEALCSAACCAIAEAASTTPSPAKKAQLVKIAQSLVKTVQQQGNRAPKLVFPGALVDGLRALLEISSLDASIDNAANAAKIWDTVMAPTSTLFNPVVASRFSENEMLSILALVSWVVSHKDKHFAKLSRQSQSLFYGLLAIVLSSESAQLRRQAFEAADALELDPSFSELYTEALVLRVTEWGLRTHTDALRIASRPGASPEIFTQLLVLAHHSLAFGSDPVSLIHSVVLRSNPPPADGKKLPNARKAVLDLLEREHQRVVSVVLSPNNLLSRANTEIGEASIRALSTCSRIAEPGSNISMSLFTGLAGAMEETARNLASSTSETDVKIFLTPEGTLYVDPVEEEEKRKEAEAAARKATSQRKRGEGKLTDEQWEQKVRKELEEKKRAESAPSEVDITKAKIAEQDKIRARVHEMLRPAYNAMRAATEAVNVNTRAAHSALPALVPVSLRLLGNALFRAHASSLVDALTATAPAPVSPLLALPVSAALREIYSGEQRTTKTSDGGIDVLLPQDTIPVITKALFDLAEGLTAPMSAAAFALLFPLSRAAVIQGPAPVLQRCQAASMKLLSSHTQPGIAYPRGELSAVLIHVMETSQRFFIRARSTLVALAEGITSLDDALIVCRGVLSPEHQVREACLSALKQIPMLSAQPTPYHPNVVTALWMTQFDTTAENSALAKEIWASYAQQIGPDYYDLLKPHMCSRMNIVRTMASAAIAEAANIHSSTVNATLNSIISLYKDSIPVVSKLTGEVETGPATEAKHFVRLGCVECIGFLGPAMTKVEQVRAVFDFMLSAPQSDDDDIRSLGVHSGMCLIEAKGSQYHDKLFPMFEERMSKTKDTGAIRERTKESLAIFMGALCKHMDPTSSKFERIVDQLRVQLRTPSEMVQQAIGNCFAAVAQSIPQPMVENTIRLLLQAVLTASSTYPERRGAASGLAGIVKGLGLSSLKKFEIMNQLSSAVEDPKKPHYRHGALVAFEMLSLSLGRLFEPYVIQILPKLLSCYGDAVGDVREAAAGAAKAIMGQLSAHGVKLVLPALLEATNDPSWRTKKKTVDLLGSMAFCAPQQLSACLPQVVPCLLRVLTDTHMEVQAAAREALQSIGGVIKNPEINTISQVVLSALDDPAQYTKAALTALEGTDFVHSIDPPSLSLLMPILQRGLKESSGETKRKASHIVGNMCSLADPRDIVPYVQMLMPGLKNLVCDPSPDVRSATAKALGSLTRGIGREHFTDLIPWLLETMRSDQGTVERAGAAQALSEVFAGLEADDLIEILEKLEQSAEETTSANAREGIFSLFRFLPQTLGATFIPRIANVMDIVIEGLADEAEFVRDSAMRAGNTIIAHYWSTAMPSILPALRQGLFDDNWRIQESTVALINELFNRVLATDPINATRDSTKVVSKALGGEAFHLLLAPLFMIRFETSAGVSQRANVIWKSVVTHPPRMLSEILPSLMKVLVDSLSSTSPHRQLIASRALGDIVERLGGKILTTIVPLLERRLDDPDPVTRSGVCLGLSEVIRAAGAELLADFVSDVVPAIRRALCDPAQQVREMAGTTFESLCESIGNKAVSEVVPQLLRDYRRPDGHMSTRALEGIKQVVGGSRGRQAMAALMPSLNKSNTTPQDAHALVTIVCFAGLSARQHLGSVIANLIEASMSDNAAAAEIREKLHDLAAQVPDALVPKFIEELTGIFKNRKGEAPARVEALATLAHFLSQPQAADLENSDKVNVDEIMGTLVELFDDASDAVQAAALGAVDKLVRAVRKESYGRFVGPIRSVLAAHSGNLAQLPSDRPRVLPAFCQANGLAPLLPVFLNSLMNAPALSGASETAGHELREQAAAGLGDLVRLTSSEALKPFFIAITGPLIRIVGDKFPWQVKAAILTTLDLILDKGEAKIKAFFPQLQSTFIKSLSEQTTKAVRSRSAEALGKLVALGTRVDPLFNEVLNALQAAFSDQSAQEAICAALACALSKSPAVTDARIVDRIGTSVLPLMSSMEEGLRMAAADAWALHLRLISADALDGYLMTCGALDTPESGAVWQLAHSRSRALGTLARSHPETFQAAAKTLLGALLGDLASDQTGVRLEAAWACGCVLSTEQLSAASAPRLVQPLTQAVTDHSADVGVAAIDAIRSWAESCPAVAKGAAQNLVVVLTARLKVCPAPVKYAVERALSVLQDLIDSQ
eukprot:m51a1_g1286 putative translational activator GCN1 (2596) ;mRNA; f:150219-159170